MFTLSILQPVVRDDNGIIDGPSTESSESNGLDDSEEEVSEVESVEGDHTHGDASESSISGRFSYRSTNSLNNFILTYL